MPEKIWKRAERQIAAFFNTVRTPLSGSNSRHNTESDTLHKRLYIEVKRNKQIMSKTLLSILDDTVQKAKKEKKLPVVCLKEHNKKGFWIIVKSNDLTDVAMESTIMGDLLEKEFK